MSLYQSLWTHLLRNASPLIFLADYLQNFSILSHKSSCLCIFIFSWFFFPTCPRDWLKNRWYFVLSASQESDKRALLISKTHIRQFGASGSGKIEMLSNQSQAISKLACQHCLLIDCCCSFFMVMVENMTDCHKEVYEVFKIFLCQVLKKCVCDDIISFFSCPCKIRYLLLLMMIFVASLNYQVRPDSIFTEDAVSSLTNKRDDHVFFNQTAWISAGVDVIDEGAPILWQWIPLSKVRSTLCVCVLHTV